MLIGGKERDISIPNPALRKIQKRILKEVLNSIRVSADCYSQRGRSSIHAARRHVRHDVLIHHDIKSFFPSTSRSRVLEALARSRVAEAAARAIVDLSMLDGLPEGASTSSALGNIVLTRLDARLGSWSQQHGITYTRYVDDLAFSGGDRLKSHAKFLRRVIEDEGWSLSSKGGVLDSSMRKQYLGVRVNSTPSPDEMLMDDARLAGRRILSRPDAFPDHYVRRVEARMRYIEQVTDESLTSRQALTDLLRQRNRLLPSD